MRGVPIGSSSKSEPYTSLVDEKITLAPYRSAYSHTRIVPRTFGEITVWGLSMYNFGIATDARWTITSASQLGMTRLRSQTSASIRVSLLCSIEGDDVMWLSITQILSPLSKSAAVRCLPMKPSPPVIKTRIHSPDQSENPLESHHEGGLWRLRVFY